MQISANCDCDFQAEFSDFRQTDRQSAKEEVIHAKVVSAKEEVATSEEVPSSHAVKPSPVAVLRGRQRQP